MTDKPDHITQLLDQAPAVPSSPELQQDILCLALLDQASEVPASPNLQQSILAAAKANRQTIINSAPQSVAASAKTQFYPNALAGGLLAASLVLGIWTGSNGIADSLISVPLELAGLQVTNNNDDDEFNLYDPTDETSPSGNQS